MRDTTSPDIPAGTIRPASTLNWSPAQLRTPLVTWTGYPATRQRFNKVRQLVEGFESAYGLELLATVHWVVTREKAQTLADVVDRTYAWNDRKEQFTQRQIKIAYETLADRGWFANPHLA